MEQAIIDYYKDLFSTLTIFEVQRKFNQTVEQFKEYPSQYGENELVEATCQLVALAQRLHFNQFGIEAAE